ncbi:halogenase [Actinoplanes sp. NBRC 14428]|uniref:FADH2 O2-dependent halogenase n=1 Tax=Pseudosporangium ferrugineum TaxID=439699 RepID=A0A2T0RXL6_9ACTN|nr:tryptophan 7-halogenase [Pseudosporangium ferrugineum]PRY25783.1 FADH2 O2-dependent halogenase [Pseudosporangium ferrugineum]BCJ56167.1 halogenase [Actinoplanes sp. NBRC 14428]
MVSPQGSATDPYDVVILGSGIAGSTLGAILARNGASVLLIDAATHPRFVVGESTTPHTLVLFKLLARRYGVPELEYLTSYDSCLSEIGRSFGIKKHFGFMLHREGEEPDPREVNQFNAPAKLNQSSHLFRQDSDAYLFHAAIRYGCVARQQYRVTDVELGEDLVCVVGPDGGRHHGRYLVDASGFRSVLATKLGLREEPSRLKHHSRSLFTHMVNVKTTDEVLAMPSSELPPVPWFQGTMHHMFPRGWFWSIPFNNEAQSRNPLVSVGLTLDERLYPVREDLTPAEEFEFYAAKYPVVQRVFADARPVREWVRTGRLQYSSRQTVGHRWCLMSHAAGFIDPLFSRGISNTAEVVNALASRLLGALADGDFSDERFRFVERLEQGLIDFNDAMVNASFIAFEHYELWNAVFRVWAYGGVPGNLRLERLIDKYEASGDDAVFAGVEHPENIGLWWPDSPAYRELFDEMVRLCAAVEAGRIPAGEAGRTLMDRIAKADFVAPSLGFADRDARFITPTREMLKELMRWLATEAPEDMRFLATGSRFAPPAGVPAGAK